METTAFITVANFNEAIQSTGPFHFVDLFRKEGKPLSETIISKIDFANRFSERINDGSEEAQIMLEGFWSGVTAMIWCDLGEAGYIVPPALAAPADITFPVLITVTTAKGLTRQEFYSKPVPVVPLPAETDVVIAMLKDYAGKTNKLDKMEQIYFFNWAYLFNGLSSEVKQKSGLRVSFQNNTPHLN